MADNWEKPVSNIGEILEGKEAHVDEFEFHQLYETNPNASMVVQGFINSAYKAVTGESQLPYVYMHNMMTVYHMKAFLKAFGEDPSKLPNDVDKLWERILATFKKNEGKEITLEETPKTPTVRVVARKPKKVEVPVEEATVADPLDAVTGDDSSDDASDEEDTEEEDGDEESAE